MNLDQVCTQLEMKSIWNRIDKWLAAKAPEIMNNLQTGTTDEAIAQAEKLLEIELPEEVKASYPIHNGQDREKPGIFEGWNFLSLEEVIKEWESWKRLFDEGVFNFREWLEQLAADLEGKKYQIDKKFYSLEKVNE